jgi:ABC-type phosphate transport system substrate-binding protein
MIRRGASLLTLLVALLIVSPGHADHALVLVTHVDSPIENLSNLELRKIYLGIAIRVDGEAIRAIRNLSDEQLDRIFLQNIVAMSERSYERRLLSFTMKYGRPRPDEIHDTNTLVERLSANPYAISYMWSTDADAEKELKILGTIWRH